MFLKFFLFYHSRHFYCRFQQWRPPQNHFPHHCQNHFLRHLHSHRFHHILRLIFIFIHSKNKNKNKKICMTRYLEYYNTVHTNDCNDSNIIPLPALSFLKNSDSVNIDFFVRCFC